jgi:hypothetical protein
MAEERVLRALRLPDWETRFRDFLRRHATADFTWGVHDCCSFAANNFMAVTGVDPILPFRNLWQDEKSAEVFVNLYGGLFSVVRHVLGEPIPNPAFIRRADIGICVGVQPVVAVCVGEYLVAPSKHGLYKLDLATLTDAWCVGGAGG